MQTYQLDSIDDLKSISIRCTPVAEVKQFNSQMDKWAIVISNGPVVETFDYYTGLGHRKHGHAVRPTNADILHSLVLDDVNGETFESWCGNFGYDTDSISALRTYEACKDNTARLAKVIAPSDIVKIKELLQDY
jgi:hypothetical protein